MSKERFVCKKRKRRPSSLTCLAFFLYIPYAYIKFYKSSTFLVSIKKKKKGFSLWIRLIVFTKSYLPKTFDCRNFVLQFQPVSRLKKVKKKKKDIDRQKSADFDNDSRTQFETLFQFDFSSKPNHQGVENPSRDGVKRLYKS